MRPAITEHDVAVIGAGVVGCAIARRLERAGLDVVLLDARGDVGDGTSKANTAILHTGFDTVPGSLESTLVTTGYKLLAEHAASAGIAVEPCGALLVAWDEEQDAALGDIRDKAIANGYLDAAIIDADEVVRREPHLGPGSRRGLEVPGESIIDPWSVSLSFAIEALRGGATIALGREVRGVEAVGDVHQLLLDDGATLRARWTINVGGLRSDEIHRMFGHHSFTVTPRRGQLLVFDKLARPLLNEILLPVPTERTKGVLVSPTVFGNVLLGPTAEDLDDIGDTASTEDGIAALLDAGRRVLPALLSEEVTAIYAGLRAATEHRDFQIESHPSERSVCVGGIRSTGLTASMAIAEHVAGLLAVAGESTEHGRELDATIVMPPLGETQRRPARDAALIERNPAYGRIVCHCEQVSAGEVFDALRSELPPSDLDGLRRRTRACNGRCQGFYCSTEILALADAAGLDLDPLGWSR